MRYAAILSAFCLVFFAAWAPAAGQSPSPDDRRAIQQVIEEQLAAFRRDDGPGAFAFASRNIQGLFQTPDIFMAMVRRGYPEVYRAAKAEFDGIVRLDGVLTQKVWVTGPGGQRVLALYAMAKTPAGEWRINGCRLLRPQEKSV